MVVSIASAGGCAAEGGAAPGGAWPFADAVEGADTGLFGGSCGGAAPTLEQVTCTPVPAEEGGEPSPKLVFALFPADEDGDLHAYELDVYLDDEVDGSVSLEGGPWSAADGEIEGYQDCEVGGGFPLLLHVPVTPDRLAYETAYEWGFVIRDARGLESEPRVVECATPPAPSEG